MLKLWWQTFFFLFGQRGGSRRAYICCLLHCVDVACFSSLFFFCSMFHLSFIFLSSDLADAARNQQRRNLFQDISKENFALFFFSFFKRKEVEMDLAGLHVAGSFLFQRWSGWCVSVARPNLCCSITSTSLFSCIDFWLILFYTSLKLGAYVRSPPLSTPWPARPTLSSGC